MVRYQILVLALTMTCCLAGQNFSTTDPAYVKNVQAGEAALKSENFDSCLIYYADAFAIKHTSYLSTMRAAACAYANGNQAMLDLYLAKAFELSWDGSKDIFENYPEFENVRKTDMMDEVLSRWKDAAKAANIDLDLMEELKEIRRTDQLYRRQMGSFENGTPEMDSLWKLQNRVDSLNTLRITKLIDERGYPGKSMVGGAQSSTAFLVIQHADLEVQEKYLDIITAAADAQEVPWSSVALLIDRIKMRNGEKQIYGSQLSLDQATGDYFFSPIENPHQIDSIRGTVGLGPLQDYADHWNLSWDPDKHLARQKKN